MDDFAGCIFGLVVVVVVVAIVTLVPALFVFLLWNWLVPAIIGLPAITFWQAWGITILFGLLFGRGSVSSSK